jgi:hypothetical protein
MKNTLQFLGVALVMTACSTANFRYTRNSVLHTTTTRQALIYDNHVVIVTRTKMSIEDYNKIVAVTVQNKEERN